MSKKHKIEQIMRISNENYPAGMLKIGERDVETQVFMAEKTRKTKLKKDKFSYHSTVRKLL